jgi:ATP-binding cassette, subfamily B, bacterial
MIARKRKQIINNIQPYFMLGDIKKTFKMLKPFIFRHWKAYLVLFSLLAIDIFFTLAFAWFFGNLTDAAIHSDFAKMKTLIPIGVILTLTSIASNYCGIYAETIASNGVKNDVKEHLFQHILRLPAEETSSLRSGDLLSYFNNDIHAVDGVIGGSLISLIKLPIIYIAVFIYLFQINWVLCLISVLIAPIAVMAGGFFGLLLKRNGRKIHELVATVNSILAETFQALQVIRSFTLEKNTFKNFSLKNKEYYRLELENAKLQGWYYSGGYLLNSITFLLSLCLGAYYVSNGVMTVGSLLTFTNLVGYLVAPLTGLAGQWAGFQRSVTAIERLIDLLERTPASADLPSYTPSINQVHSIQFQDIHFSYDENQRLFEDVNLDIPAGKVVAIVGPSGGGKSTLFNLLQGIYKPQKGCILLNGKSTEGYTLSELRSAIAHVPQETFLFAGTIRENLLLARPNITEAEMIRAAIDANIHEFVMSLPDDYHTQIGERGIKLSGGQKQRVAIARAILKDAPILLLDEATSALDSETEYHVKEALDGLKKGRTTMVIAYRLSTIQNADLIIVLDKGKIVQMGSHEELLYKQGLYQNLNNTQFQSKIEKPLANVSG